MYVMESTCVMSEIRDCIRGSGNSATRGTCLHDSSPRCDSSQMLLQGLVLVTTHALSPQETAVPLRVHCCSSEGEVWAASLALRGKMRCCQVVLCIPSIIHDQHACRSPRARRTSEKQSREQQHRQTQHCPVFPLALFVRPRYFITTSLVVPPSCNPLYVQILIQLMIKFI
jgi:hypothetical protein